MERGDENAWNMATINGVSIGFLGDFCGILWDLMGFYGISMGFYRISMGFDGILCCNMGGVLKMKLPKNGL